MVGTMLLHMVGVMSCVIFAFFLWPHYLMLVPELWLWISLIRALCMVPYGLSVLAECTHHWSCRVQ